jgi:hypothetical protein
MEETGGFVNFAASSGDCGGADKVKVEDDVRHSSGG